MKSPKRLSIAAALVVAAVSLLPKPAAGYTCDQLFAHYNNSNWWWGAFGNCKTGPGGLTDRSAIFECAWAQVPASDRTDCLKEKLRQSAHTNQGIDVVVAYNSLSCDQLFAHYNNSSWWWGAFGNCKTGPGGQTDRNAIFECAWVQVPASHRNDCLKGKLRQTAQTSQGIDAVVAYNSVCEQLLAHYNGSAWWWGAFGNCKTGPGGLTDRAAVFECAWAQVPANDRIDCLKDKLRQTAHTNQGIDAVVAHNSVTVCDQLFAHYNGSAWWWGAFGNCKTGFGGPSEPAAIFECAWAQVPATDKNDCLKGKLLQSEQTGRAIAEVQGYNSFSFSAGPIFGGRSPANPPPVNMPSKPCEGITPDGSRVTFQFDVYCGRSYVYTLPMEACARPDALARAKTHLSLGCYINETTSTPIGTPPPPNPASPCKQKLFKFCVTCDSGDGPIYSQQSVYSCLADTALDSIIESRPYFCSAKLLDKSCPEPK